MKELLKALQADRGEPTREIQVVIPWDVNRVTGTVPHVPKDQVPPDAQLVDSPISTIDLHPQARASFDTKANALLSELMSAPAEENIAIDAAQSRNSELIAATIPDYAVRGEIEVFRDGDGEVMARLFVHAGMITGLKDSGYLALRRLAEAMQHTPSLRMIIGVDTLEQLLFEWVRSRVVGSSEATMSEFVLGRVAALVTEYEVVLPLFRVELPEPIQIGAVILRTITAADFVRWEGDLVSESKSQNEGDQLRALFWNERKKMQGFAGAIMVLRGEGNQVVKIASEVAEEAVSILRLFSPAILSPHAQSFCTLWGRQHLESTSYVTFRPDPHEVNIGSHVTTSNDFVWRIEAARWRLIREDGMDALIQSLYENKATVFHGEVKAAIVLYSQSALKALPADKLLTIFIPLESLLLRSQSEPISENIAFRLAFAIGETQAERKRIVGNVRAVYAMRSAYVHHRRAITGVEALENLREFMEYAWRFFIRIGIIASNYEDRLSYLNTLDEGKFGVP